MLKFAHNEIVHRFHRRFARLYGEAEVERCLRRLKMLLGRYGIGGDTGPDGAALWSEEDVLLITYADMVRGPEHEAPLRALKRFCDRRLDGVVSLVHLLPFFPYSSDDGFSVIDYRDVNPDFGEWSDVEALRDRFDLMFDLVLNHCSQHSSWFKQYLNGVLPGRHYFHEIDPETDLSEVVRPRSRPLLTQVLTRDGDRHVWTTFSDDQIDLDFSNPDVLFEFLDILLFYVYRGARMVRMDAIAYLWKRIGTSCIHLPETHEVVKLFRDFLRLLAPQTLLLTETNVPHQENLSYFGDGDEANMVYNFSLPPLLLCALTSGDAEHLTRWASSIMPPGPQRTFLNFTASHDGVGVRPLEGIVPDHARDTLFDRVRDLGGRISTKRNADGTDTPYELNITYFDALADDPETVTDRHVARFLCSQTIPLALLGMPAIYFHSLTATRNWPDGFDATGQPRTLNRRKWTEAELDERLDDAAHPAARVFAELVRRLRIRRAHPAFHPEAPQTVINLDPRVFAVVRTAMDESEAVVCLHNVADEAVTVDIDERISAMKSGGAWRDCLAPEDADAVTVRRGEQLTLAPYQATWLTRAADPDTDASASDTTA